jgi:hypothetical protein
VLLVLSCSDVATTGGGDPVSGAGGKADEASVEILTSENLGSGERRLAICESIADRLTVPTDFVERCDRHDMKVTRTLKSTLYGHLDTGAALTLEMSVHVEANHGLSFDCEVARAYDPRSHQFDWRTDCAPPWGEGSNDFLVRLAASAGEYFDVTAIEDHVTETTYADLPAGVMTAVNPYMQATIERNRGAEPSFMASVGDGVAPYLVWEEETHDDVVGYIVHIDFSVDHPLFDGAGVHLYFNEQFELAAEVEWTG